MVKGKTFLSWGSLPVLLAMLVTPVVYGQRTSEPVRSLVKKLTDYGNGHVQEKLFVHTDRSLYLTGESLWLKVYSVDGFFHRPLAISKVAYVEVIDGTQKPVVQSKIAMTDGSGAGMLFLPVSLPSGQYLLRAYTTWMRNGNANLYFQQSITIVNPFVPLPPVAKAEALPYDVQFFPEGGNLVYGLESVVGFRVVDETGHGARLRGAVVNEKNDTIIRFNTLKWGMGRFTFTPLKDHQYRAVLTDARQKKLIYNLSVPYEEGTVVRLSETPTRIDLKVTTQSKTNETQSVVHLIAHSRQRRIIFDSRYPEQGVAVFSINKSAMGEGITHLTIFNEQLAPVCERLYFRKPTQDLTISVIPESPNYTARKKVSLSINAVSAGANTMANLSASVFKIDSMDRQGQHIVNYLMMSSELKGAIESPGYYFEPNSTPEQIEATDNLMLTQGWSRFKWEDVLANARADEFAPEYNGHIITGQIRERGTKNPVRGMMTYLTAAGVYTKPYGSRSNDQGKLFFEMQHFYGDNEMIAQTGTRQDSLYSIEIFSPFSKDMPAFALSPLHLDGRSIADIEQRSIHMQVQNMISKTGRGLVKKPVFDSISFYGRPDDKYKLDDYTRFPTMEEVMREYVKGIQVRKHRDGFHIMNYDQVNRAFFQNDPFIMLDGVPLFDVDWIMAFDPRKVKSLEVVNRKYYMGTASFDGILNYRTYQGDLGGLQPNPYAMLMRYDGLQLQREFFSPVYETGHQKESTLPDVRNLLYWSPAVTTDAAGKGQLQFYTSDITGKYIVVIQGITKEGVPGYGTATFEVVGKDNY